MVRYLSLFIENSEIKSPAEKVYIDISEDISSFL